MQHIQQEIALEMYGKSTPAQDCWLPTVAVLAEPPEWLADMV